jgi:hypothetical protein
MTAWDFAFCVGEIGFGLWDWLGSGTGFSLGEDPRNARGGNGFVRGVRASRNALGPTRSRDLRQEMLSEGYHVLFSGTRTWYTLPSNRSTELGVRDDRVGGTRLFAVLGFAIRAYLVDLLV